MPTGVKDGGGARGGFWGCLGLCKGIDVCVDVWT